MRWLCEKENGSYVTVATCFLSDGQLKTKLMTKEYKLPVWMHKYAQIIGGKGETVEGIEWYMSGEKLAPSAAYTQTIYKAKIELLESLHKAHLI